MQQHNFTEEQIQKLQSNPYTKSVSPYTLKFTDAFKKEFWLQHLEGTSPEKIFIHLGYDPDIVGKHRIANTAYLISKKFSATKDNPALKLSQGEEIEDLENRVRILEKQLESLKKSIHLNNQKNQRNHQAL